MPYYVPGDRFVLEVDTEEDRKMKARAKVKLEKISAEKRKREAEAEHPTSAFSGNPQWTSTPAFNEQAPEMRWGQPQGSVMAPCTYAKLKMDLIQNNFPEADVSAYNGNDS